MSPVQRTSFFMLMVSLATLVAYVALLLWRGPEVAMASMVVMALSAALPFIQKDERKDERERLLAARGLRFGLSAAYIFVGLVCMGLWFARYDSPTPVVDVNVLPAIAMGSWVVSTVVWSSAVLIMARRPLEVG